ncbi:MAG: HipA domain-containing protein [Saprospiraceae bacterium]
MTMLGYLDGKNGASYLDLADFLTSHGAKVQSDLEQLWRRIVFNLCVANTDDHLRNHGFLLTPNGWCLSPAYDINPNPYGNGLSLNISEHDNSLSLDLAMEVSPFFRLTEARSREIMREVCAAVSDWRECAARHGLSKHEQDRMASAFAACE